MSAALFVRADSVYKTMPGVDAWDIERDARRWPGGEPVIAHPPCRAWGRLQHIAKPRDDERALGLWAVDQVRRWGGVLEHPASSSLWLYCCMPAPDGRSTDLFGGWTLPIAQHWFGHRAVKLTWLYIVGVAPRELPPIPFVLGKSTHVIAQNRTLPGGRRLRKGMPAWRPEVTKAEREHTPPDLARWLVDLASRVERMKEAA